MAHTNRIGRRQFWGTLAVAVIGTAATVWEPDFREPRSAFKPISGIVVGFERHPNTRGRSREFVVLNVHGERFLLGSGPYISEHLRMLRKGDHVEALVSTDFPVELKSSGKGSYTYDSYMAKIDSDGKRWRPFKIALCVFLWILVVVGVVDRSLSSGEKRGAGVDV